jgi:NAD(P)-dependent dehydrogenase (short-subunit alcohol dehydrogenase family)
MTYWQGKRAVIVGGSSGLGRALAAVLVERGARVAIAARRQESLDNAVAELQSLTLPLGEGRGEGEVFAIPADVTSAADLERLAIAVHERWGGVDFVAHTAGRSMRGDAITTSPEKFQELWELNFLSAVRTAQDFAADLVHSRGHLVLVGSLAGKCAPRYLGAYPASKFPLAAFAQQLRMELGPKGVHTLLVSPGPIARAESTVGGVSDADMTSSRYGDQTADLPESATRPGGGARLTAIDPTALAKKILTACESRRPELVIPAKSKLLFALAQLWPTLADWILQKRTSDD